MTPGVSVANSPAVRIAVIGLGYVGLPLAVAFARHFSVVGFDIDKRRIGELARGHDRTGEIDSPMLKASTCRFTASSPDMTGCDLFVITVPTPVDEAQRPDLGAVRSAAEIVGRVLAKGAIVVLESTVAPGTTEEVCGPILARISGLASGKDFHLGYSPERINPGDREHTVERITKVVAGDTPETARRLAEIYGAITSGGTFVARSIRTAEAAKVIENAQRDINIAFINEVALIFERAGLSIHDVLDASATKWNFLRFSPGLVGGHCIGVDPYYLAEFARTQGYHPEIVLAGRRINDAMGDQVAGRIAAVHSKGGRALVLGFTFKENVPDLRNSKVIDVVRGLERRGFAVDVHDPFADAEEARHHHAVLLLPDLETAQGYDVLVGAVGHRPYTAFTSADFHRLVRAGGLVADLKGIWRKTELPPSLARWQL